MYLNLYIAIGRNQTEYEQLILIIDRSFIAVAVLAAAYCRNLWITRKNDPTDNHYDPINLRS